MRQPYVRIAVKMIEVLARLVDVCLAREFLEGGGSNLLCKTMKGAVASADE
jgi:hypothetical protein